ncbi:hypothetical protein BFO01nite_19170 [Brevibacillus formosus]|uniref:Uncharacterized protein n=1 Tax=Brevibacillus formosus TaxID=54913 RepID=A0ABQ0T3A6_9BACL|nr:hypothetical protein BFO01nite_19170 [Brevibacillus formosus]
MIVGYKPSLQDEKYFVHIQICFLNAKYSYVGNLHCKPYRSVVKYRQLIFPKGNNFSLSQIFGVGRNMIP